MIKPIKKEWRLQALLPIAALAALVSCNVTELSPSASSGQIAYDSSYANKALIYPDSPSILASPGYGNKIDISAFLDKRNPQFITDNSQLKSDCGMEFNYYYIPYRTDAVKTDCVQSYGVKGALESLPTRQADGTWIYAAGSREFYQVNALYHLNKGISTFFDKMSFAYKKLHGGTSLLNVQKNIPAYLKSSNLWWFKGVSSENSLQFKNDFLTSYATCENFDNAQFNPAGPELCFGSDPSRPNFYYVQDPSVVYHELGHALVAVMMNLRNGTTASDTTLFRSNLVAHGYNESGSLNEGLADYFSYVMNGRTHIGEWALGRFSSQSRPMSESDPMHIPGIDTTPEGRLSYPQYLLYDPNDPDQPFEDIHYAGQIVSHYLVALTETLRNKCTPEEGMTAQDTATSYVMMLIAETLSEVGDLRSVGLDYATSAFYPNPASNYYFTNLDPTSSYTWATLVNPTSYRRFFQTMGKNIKKFIAQNGSGNFCSSLSVTESERLLDDYGLLLFRSYNDNGNSTKSATIFYKTAITSMPTASISNVTEANRRKSILMSKDLLSLATVTSDRPSYFIIDDAQTMSGYLSNLLFKGIATTLSTNVSGTQYNNNNVKISPGEVVAIIPNLYNSSNSPMAGIQILANDFDHMIYDALTGYYKPCVIDTTTTTDQGAIAPLTTNDCGTTMTEYKKYTRSIAGGAYPTQAAQPICMVQMDGADSSRWVSQNEFRKKQGLALLDKDCLGFSNTGSFSDQDFTFNPNECLIRVLPGSADANFSKIDPQKSYVETIRSTTTSTVFNPGNAFVIEVNKWIPPGTKFRCRLRARFTNCTDCYTDSANTLFPTDDFIDSEYNGAKPYKVINFDFTVND